jgi:hypothetical protein
MNIVLDVLLSFPTDVETNRIFTKLYKFCGSIEDVENDFDVEFSCGDGKYLSDFWSWTEGDSLVANYHTDEEYEEVAKYDGKVCLKTPPRFRQVKMSQVPEKMKQDKSYRFTVKYYEKSQEYVFYINSKERSRKWVG